MSGQRTLIVTTKNEGPFLLEWVAYHRLIGFDNIVIFANDCDDGSEKLLKAMSQFGLIRYYGNSERPDGLPADPQNRAYRRAFAMDHVIKSEWVMVMDADEFFNIHAGDGTLDSLFSAVGHADIVSGTWCVYGNSGRIAFEDDLITAQFTHCAPKDVQVSFRHFGLKTMFRPKPVHRLGIHRPFLKGGFKKAGTPLRWLNGSGVDVTEHYREKGWAASMATNGYDLCQINHYMIKSNELFLMKRFRGTANSVDEDRINFDYYDSFNSNHTTDSSVTRWTIPIRSEIARIRQQCELIAKSHDDCVKYFKSKIAILTDVLAETDPEAYQRLLDPGSVAKQVRVDEAALVKLRPKKGNAPPKSPPATRKSRSVLRDDDRAPEWLADFRRSEHREGFYHSSTKFAAHYVDRGKRKLIISFDNLSSVNDPSLARDGWGYTFYRDEGWSHLGVLSFEANWYRDDNLFLFMEDRAASGFFAQFETVVLTGTSMGAYAATAFARLIPGSTVLAFSPQSTLDSKLVPWEKRFPKGRNQDWSGRYRDGAEDLSQAGSVFIFFDPDFAPDRMHSERYTGTNIVLLKTWFTNHKSALFLRRAELLKPVVRLAMGGLLTEASFYSLYRNRRSLPWYINGLTEKALSQGHKELVKRVSAALVREGRSHLGQSVERRLNKASEE